MPVFVFLLATTLAGWMQWRSGSWTADLSAYPDESSHYVTALAIYSYAHNGVGQSPVAFMRNYYASFPRVAIGHWPPMFHILVALIPFSFSRSVMAVLLFQAAVTGAASVVCFFWLRREITYLEAAGLAGFLPMIYYVAWSTRTTMTEPLLMFWIAATGLAIVRYIESPSLERTLMIALLIAACLLTKVNGALLLFALPLAIALQRRWELLRNTKSWLPALLILTPAILWYAVFWGAATRGWEGTTDVMWLLTQLAPNNLRAIKAVGGWGLLLAALMGIRLTRPASAVAAAIILAAFGFHTFIAPTDEARHFTAIAVPLLVLAGIGLARFSRTTRIPFAVTAALFVALIGYSTLHISPKADLGASRMAGLLFRSSPSPPTMLVAGDSEFEGTVIGTVAARSAAPSRATVYRIGKIPALDDRSSARVEQLVQSLDVRWVVLQADARRTQAPQDLLDEALRARPDRWRQMLESNPSQQRVIVFERRVRDPTIPSANLRQAP